MNNCLPTISAFFVVLDYKEDGNLQSKSIKSTSDEQEAQVVSRVVLGNVDNYVTEDQEPVCLQIFGPCGEIVEFAALAVPHVGSAWMFMGDFNA